MDENEQAPGAWTIDQSFECAFVLIEDLLFASGFEAGVTCAWSNGPDVACEPPPES